MKRRTAGVLLAIGASGVLVVALSASGLLPQAGSVLQELSVKEPQAHDSFFDLVWDGSPYAPGGQKVFKSAAPAARAAIVTSLGTLLKAYTRTPVFRTRYAEYWEANQPRPPEPPPSLADRNKETDESIAQAEANIKNMPPDMQKQMQEAVKQMKAQQEAMRKDAAMQKMMADAMQQSQEASLKQHEAALTEYEAKHPKNPDELIAKRLKEFLDLSATVDHQAKLMKSGDLMRFENAAFEHKPAEWKLCYRAGKEATDAARAVAADWLKELAAK